MSGSIPERAKDGKLYNSSTVWSPCGDLTATHRKVHLFDIDIPGKIKFKESEVLTAGSSLTHFDTGINNRMIFFKLSDMGRIGLGICYDMRFPEMAMVAARRGCKLMIYPGAFNMTTGPMHWELLQRSRALDNQMYVATVSPARDTEAEYVAWGHSSVVDPMGQVVATTDDQESIVYCDVDFDQVDSARSSIPVQSQRRFDLYPDVAAEHNE